MILDLVTLVAMTVLAVLFGVFVSAMALTAAVWFIGVHLWAKLSGRRDV